MGTVISASKFLTENPASLSKPFIYCCPYEDLECEAFSIGRALAKELIAIQPNRRTMKLEKCFKNVISDLPECVVIKDIDVIFNPSYKVDILNLLIAVYKKKPFSVIWPGIYIDGKLVYAEEGYPDYKAYSISDYDVTCII